MIVADAVGPLAGFTVAVTALDRRLEIGAALEHHGARVVYAALRAEVIAETGVAGPTDVGLDEGPEYAPADAPWCPPRDRHPGRLLIRGLIERTVDAVTFVETRSADGLLRLAGSRAGRLTEALVDDVVVVALDDRVAEPLRAAGVPVRVPNRPRLAALVRQVVRDVPSRRGRHLVAGGHRLDVRAHLVVVDGVPVSLDPPAAAVLRRLVERPGYAISAPREQVERLRAQLGDSRLVVAAGRSAVRLSVDPDAPPTVASGPPRPQAVRQNQDAAR